MLLPLAIALAATTAADPAATGTVSAMQPVCRDAQPLSVRDPGGAARVRKLGELPPANLVLTVLRSAGGCTRPVIVRYGIGGTPAAPVATRASAAQRP